MTQCDCDSCRLARRIGKLKDRVDAEGVAVLKELWGRMEAAEVDAAVAKMKLSAIRAVCDGGLTAATRVLEGD